MRKSHLTGNAFLSRLCGGEEIHSRITPLVHFLSRLCGGEAFRMGAAQPPVFLSRLCGGEVRSPLA